MARRRDGLRLEADATERLLRDKLRLLGGGAPRRQNHALDLLTGQPEPMGVPAAATADVASLTEEAPVPVADDQATGPGSPPARVTPRTVYLSASDLAGLDALVARERRPGTGSSSRSAVIRRAIAELLKRAQAAGPRAHE